MTALRMFHFLTALFGPRADERVLARYRQAFALDSDERDYALPLTSAQAGSSFGPVS